MAPTRSLQIDGAYNVRDLGGYETVDGRRTRWRTFIRSDSLHRLTPASQVKLVGYGVHTVIDLRTSAEINGQPNVFAGSTQVSYRHIIMVGDSFAGPSAGHELPMRVVNQYRLTLDQRLAQIGEIMALLAAPVSGAVLFHCAGGQDRTGLIAALLLGVAGVPPETIAEDYTLTAQYAVDLYLGKDAPPDVAPADYTVEAYRRRNCPPEAMMLTLEHLERRYGGVEGYLRASGVSDGELTSLRASLLK